MKMRVTYEHDATITYKAIVEANSVEEAEEKVHNWDVTEEHEMDHQGMMVRIIAIEEDYNE